MRRAIFALGVALAASGVACSLLVDLDGLRTPADGSPDVIQTTDGGQTDWCSERIDADYCEDFDRVGFEGGAAIGGGTVGLWSYDFVSPPASGRAAVPANTDAGGFTIMGTFGQLVQAQGRRHVVLDWEMKLATLPTTTVSTGLAFAGVTMNGTDNVYLVLSGPWSVYVTGSKSDYVLTRPLPVGTWNHLVLDVTFATATGSLTLSLVADDGGVETLASASGIATGPSSTTAATMVGFVGVVSLAPGAPAADVLVDDIVATLD